MIFDEAFVLFLRQLILISFPHITIVISKELNSNIAEEVNNSKTFICHKAVDISKMVNTN